MQNNLVKTNSYYYIFFISMIAALAGLLVGYDAGIIADSKEQVMKLFHLSDHQWSAIACISVVGALLGLPVTGILSRRISRKMLLLIVATGFITSLIITASASNIFSFMSGRFIAGISIGIASFTTPLFIAEISPRNIRGSLVLVNGLAITFGQALSFLVGYLAHDINEHSWRYVISIGLVPAVILLGGIAFVPQSPRWIAMKYGMDKCREVLYKLRGSDDNEILIELNEIQSNLAQNSAHARVRDLFSRRLLPVTLIGVGLGIFQQFTGISALMYYGPVIFSSAGFSPERYAILATFGIGMINLFATLITLLLVDHVGRRSLLLGGSLLAGASLLAISAAPEPDKWVIFGLIGAFILGYCISLGSLFWVIISEIFPLNIRGLAMSVATIAEMTANLIVTFSFLQLLHTLGITGTYMLYSVMCFISFIFIYFFIPETKGVSLERIEKNLANGSRARDLGDNHDYILNQDSVS